MGLRAQRWASSPGLPPTGPGPSLGLSFLQVKHRTGTQCLHDSLSGFSSPSSLVALALTSDLRSFLKSR